MDKIVEFDVLKNLIVSRGTNLADYIDQNFYSKLKIYIESLLKWNLKINLIGKSTIEDIYCRHILDSLQLMNHIDNPNKSVIDLGSGAGLPGIILAIAGVKKVSLVESDKRKCIFLNEISENINNIEVLNMRVEKTPNLHYDIVTARALAPLNKLLEMAIIFNHSSIEYVFLKGEKIIDEINEAKKNFKFNYELFPSLTHNKSFIIKICNLYK